MIYNLNPSVEIRLEGIIHETEATRLVSRSFCFILHFGALHYDYLWEIRHILSYRTCQPLKNGIILTYKGLFLPYNREHNSISMLYNVWQTKASHKSIDSPCTTALEQVDGGLETGFHTLYSRRRKYILKRRLNIFPNLEFHLYIKG